MTQPESGDRYPPDEAARRRDEVVKRMLNTPPQPHRAKPRAAKPKEQPIREGQPGPVKAGS